MRNRLYITLTWNRLIRFISSQDTPANYINRVDGLSNKYVDNGFVNYQAAPDSPEQVNYPVRTITTFNIESLTTPNLTKAWRINTHNVPLLKGIIYLFPFYSSLGVPRVFNSIRYDVTGESFTLDDVEEKRFQSLTQKGRSTATF